MHNKSLRQLHEELKSGARTVEALVDSYKKIIEEKDGDIHAFLGMYSDALVARQIEKAKSMFAEGKATVLTGIPFAIKDSIVVQGEKATGGSKILENYISPYDADVIEALKDAGAVLLGRANLDEFCIGGSTENSAYGPTKNPHDITRVPGGTSGGSAAAVGAGMVPAALGSDTGGSIRQPASFCGVVGLKTTYGMTSRYGTMAMGSSLDQVGPIGNSVEDVEDIFSIISRHDVRDGTSLPATHRSHDKKVVGKKIGVPWSFIRREGVDTEVLENFEASLEKMKQAGYEIVDITIPNIEKTLSVYYVIMFAEVSSNLARYDGVRYGLSVPGKNSIEGYFKSRTQGFGEEVKRRILLGTYVLSSGYYDAYYNKAQLLRGELKKSFKKLFDQVDAIAMPTSPIPAFKIGEKSHDPLAMYLADIFTVPVNIVGVPAISIPSGKTSSGLPLGMQFIASHAREDILFTVGKDFEKVV